MPGVPSNKACDQCKKRHIKCDETRPGCQKCAAAGIDCPGYSQDRKFIDEGATVRRRYTPYRRGVARQSSNRAAEAYESLGSSNEVTDEDAAISSLAPNPLVQTATGFGSATEEHDTTPRDMNSNQPGPNEPQIISQLGSNYPGGSSSAVQDSLSSTNQLNHTNIINNPMPYENAFDFQWNMNLVPDLLPQSTTPLVSSQSGNEMNSFYSELMMNSEREVTFLTRHYAECIGPWFDLHDSERFFTLYCPSRARHVPFIQHAISAVSAKHLGRINGIKPSTGLNVNPAITQTYPNTAGVDWSFKASNYYFQSISYLMQTITGNVDLQQIDVSASPIQILCHILGLDITRTDKRQPVISTATLVNWDDILCGAVLLTAYDILDAQGPDWEARLLGVQVLLECSILLPNQQPRPVISHAVRASFWTLACFDYLASYVNRRRPRIDPSNLDLFRAIGLHIDNNGKLQLEMIDRTIPSHRDETFSHSLTFLMLQLMNFIAEFKEMQQAVMQSTTPPDISFDAPIPQSSGLTATWRRLTQEVDSWRSALPDSFQPYLILENPRDLSSSSPAAPFPELVFSTSSHASTIAHYNFARIILLLNRPHDAQSTPRDRLLGYREVTKEVDGCVREIAGIASAKPHAATQTYMLQPLFVVGQCDDRPEARRKVVELIREMRTELGWETEYRVAQIQALRDRA
ncbi:hypothetical protein BGW36DRAFT_401817 [Talaromyces proteolyticus]|uniref:Zn(2)-C6 fungal-type domain-containing protein n=1 Tax=Talaromyces proteolyticus TaxID=1131652 RepID=A0AAD4KDC7_9EURO|nr:uncharacterized protein BGW36DRAFT_401817 [Talaromyces proteolyticus]KAH8689451.1 hypothetical protein BGW36DRAFT_401817 [Talaromyces proteolyticus]